jgi:protein SCO1/2
VIRFIPALRSTAALLAAASALSACGAPGRPAAAFTLTGDNGRPWSLAAAHGRTVLLTFGFTHCADTCPETLAKLRRLRDGLGKAGRNVEIAFVTVDPQRDTPPVLHRFLARFGGASAGIVGLTGTPAQIASVESAYHVWAQRIPGHGGAARYDEAHTAVIFFIDPAGRIRALRDDDDSDAVLARALREATS